MPYPTPRIDLCYVPDKCLTPSKPTLVLHSAQTPNTGLLQQYYKAGYAIVRQYCSACFVIISPREFELSGAAWQPFMAASPYYKVLQDIHRRAVLRGSITVRQSRAGSIPMLELPKSYTGQVQPACVARIRSYHAEAQVLISSLLVS